MAAITPTVKLTLSGKMQAVTVNDYYAGERFIVDDQCLQRVSGHPAVSPIG